MERTIVNLGGYGDFDMPYVDSTWMSPDGMDPEDAKEIIQNVEHDNSNTDRLDKAVKQLKQAGFVKVQSMECLVGGNL